MFDFLDTDSYQRREQIPDLHLKTPITNNYKRVFQKSAETMILYKSLNNEEQLEYRYKMNIKLNMPRTICDILLTLSISSLNAIVNSIIESENLYGCILPGLLIIKTRKIFHEVDKKNYKSISPILEIVDNFSKAHNINCSNELRAISELSLATCESFTRCVLEELRLLMAINIKTYNYTPRVFLIQENSLLSKISVLYNLSFWTVAGKRYMIDSDQINMLTDTVTSRYLVRVSSRMYRTFYTKLHQTYPTENEFDQLFSLFDYLLSRHGNKAYKCIKLYESLVLSTILLKTSITESSIFRRYYSSCWESFNNEMNDFNESNLLSLSFRNFFISLEVPKLVELYGLFRLWGHPTVDERGGMKAVKKVVDDGKKFKFDEDLLIDIHGVMMKQIIEEYMKLHKQWPPVSSWGNLDVNHPIRVAHSTGVISYDAICKDVPWSDWSKIEFSKFHDFDFYKDYTETLDDKSICVPRDKWAGLYEMSLIGKENVVVNRRLLKEILLTATYNIEEIILTISKDELPENEYIACLRAKERELKIDPRMFVMFRHNLRVYFLATESNLGKTILKYFPQITMTLSESSLNKLLLDISNINTKGYNNKIFKHNKVQISQQEAIDLGVKYNENKDSTEKPSVSDKSTINKYLLGEYFWQIKVFFNMDFQKWNLHFQLSNTERYFKVLDQIFGVPDLYSRTHKIFAKLWVTLSSRYNPPENFTDNIDDMQESDQIWKNHTSGFEGIRQKGWTIITSCILQYIADRLRIKCRIIGQGDNQVLEVTFDSPFDPKNQKEDADTWLSLQIELLLRELDRVFSLMDLPIKKDESWISKRVFAYGKEIFVDGVQMSMSLKKLSRLLPEVNQIFPTLNNKIAALGTAGQSAALKGHDFIIPYIISNLETLRLIKIDRIVSILNHSLNLQPQESGYQFDMYNLLLPSILGGYPVLPIHEYVYRGNPDPLTAVISTLKCLALQGTTMAHHILSSIGIEIPFSDEINYRMLITDPTSINIIPSNSSTSRIKATVKDALTKTIVNDDLKLLFHRDCELEDDKLVEYLMSIKPNVPRVLNILYQNSPSGARDHFVQMITTAVTAIKMISTEDYNSLSKHVSYQEIRQNKILIERYSKLNRNLVYDLNSCSTEIADIYRSFSWKLDKVVGSTVPHPIEMMELHEVTINPHEMLSNDHVEYISFSLSLTKDNFNERGSNDPYIGSQTKVKMSKGRELSNISNRPLEAAIKINTLIKWVIQPGSELNNFLLSLCQLRCLVDQSLLDMLTGTICGGSIEHRLQDPCTKHDAHINSRPTFSSHISISTNKMGKYSKGENNYNIHFQGLMLYGKQIIQFLRLLSTKSIKDKMITYCFHVNCKLCIKPLEIEKLNSLSETPILTENYQNCPLIHSCFEYNKSPLDLPSMEHIRLVDMGYTEDMCSYSVGYLMAHVWQSDNTRISESMNNSRFSSQLKEIGVGELVRLSLHKILDSFCKTIIMESIENILQISITLNCSLETSFGYLMLNCKIKPFTYLSGFTLLEAMLIQYSDLEILPLISVDKLTKGGDISDQLIIYMISRVKVFLDRILNPKKEIKPHLVLSTNDNMKGKLINVLKSKLILHLIKEYGVKEAYMKLPSILPSFFDTYYDIINNYIKDTDQTLNFYINYVPKHPLLFISHIKLLTIYVPPSVRQLKTISPSDIFSNWDESDIYRYSCELPINPETKKSILLGMQQSALKQHFSLKTKRDHYYRSYGTITTSSYKYIPIFKKEITKRNISNVLCLAEGAGGVAQSIMEIYKPIKLYLATLTDIGVSNTSFAINYIPPCLINYKDREGVMNSSFDNIIHGGDILSINTENSIKSFYGKETVDLITMDAEWPNSEEYESMIISLIEKTIYYSNHLLASDGITIMKAFSGNRPLIVNILKYCSYWYNCKLILPYHCSWENSEFFIVLKKKNFNGNIISLEEYNRVILGAVDDLSLIRSMSKGPYQRQSNSLNLWLDNIFKIYLSDCWITSMQHITNDLSLIIPDQKLKTLESIQSTLDLISSALFSQENLKTLWSSKRDIISSIYTATKSDDGVKIKVLTKNSLLKINTRKDSILHLLSKINQSTRYEDAKKLIIDDVQVLSATNGKVKPLLKDDNYWDEIYDLFQKTEDELIEGNDLTTKDKESQEDINTRLMTEFHDLMYESEEENEENIPTIETTKEEYKTEKIKTVTKTIVNQLNEASHIIYKLKTSMIKNKFLRHHISKSNITQYLDSLILLKGIYFFAGIDEAKIAESEIRVYFTTEFALYPPKHFMSSEVIEYLLLETKKSKIGKMSSSSYTFLIHHAISYERFLALYSKHWWKVLGIVNSNIKQTSM